MTARFTLDKGNGKLLGVCAGIARWADMDPFWSGSAPSR
jgi:phage shock protein PspC (stress-responsive transcriptional regulator)